VNKESLSSVLLAAILVGGLILAIAHFGKVQASTDVSGIPKPSVPEFTLKYVDHSYDVPPTYGIDPYTGKTMLTQSGYHVQNNSVELIIKNQPYHSYRNENGSLIWLYYLVAIKGHFENWTDDNWASQTINLKTYDSYPLNYIPSSENSEYTVITYGLDGDNGTDTAYQYRSPTYYTPPYYGYYDYTLGNVSVGGQVDFRVQSIIGYSTRINETLSGPPIGLDPGDVPHYYIFTGQTSDWSNTQTITIGESQTPTPSPANSPTPSQEPTLTQEQTETIIGAAIIVAVISAGLGFLLYLIKRK
jgi:hypothetical protein